MKTEVKKLRHSFESEFKWKAREIPAINSNNLKSEGTSENIPGIQFELPAICKKKIKIKY